MRIQSTRYRATTLWVVAILVAMLCLPGISEARTPIAMGNDVSLYQTGSQVESGQSSTSLAEVLNPDGTLNLPRGFNGSLDPAGFTLASGPKGEPRFTPSQGKGEEEKGNPTDKGGDQQASPNAPGTYRWDNRINIRGADSAVSAIAVNGNDVYVGGWFTGIGNAAANYIARWDGINWYKLGSGANAAVTAIAISGSNVYAGGDFTQIGGVMANRVARWNGSQWSTMGNGVNNGVNNTVRALAVSGNNVYAGGNFTSAGGNTANH
ncbi:MAG: hypothetical protein ABIQ44_13955, partial [Chloroflexia bacterium]